MYVKYCENKPKSESIVAEFIDFFEVNDTVIFPIIYLFIMLLWIGVILWLCNVHAKQRQNRTEISSTVIYDGLSIHSKIVST